MTQPPLSLRSASRIGLALALALASAVATGAFAQQADAGRGRQMAVELQERFTAADSNGDGKLTKDEAKNGMPFVYKHYDEIDTAKTGAITMRDIAAFAAAQRAARKAAP